MKSFALRPRAVRALALFGAMVSILIIYMLRLVQLQVFQYDEWSRRSRANHLSQRILEMKRGAITDRNGLDLAISVETYSVFLFTREVKNVAETANLISTVLPMTRDHILEKVANRKGYIPIFQKLERGPAQKLTALKLPGVILEENYRRIYPQNSLAANLLGFCGTDGNGLEGLELFFNKTMRGYAGLAVQEDASYGEDGPAMMRIVQPPMGGSNMVLTLDSFIQHILETELSTLIEKFQPIDATAIAMDPATGEILGMACLPTYDLNQFADSTPDSHRNRPLVDIFEPGSCMKIFATACALQTGRVLQNTRFYCKGFGEVGSRRVKCHGAHGLLDIDEVIAQSCNASMVQLSQMIEPQDLYRLYKKLGFGAPTGLDAPAESSGMFLPPSKWSGFSAASLCIGQEIAVTGIQLIRAYAAIANGGFLMQPQIIKKIVSRTGDITEDFPPKLVQRVFSPEIAQHLRKMLMGVVEIGTGKLAALPEYTVAGKTSTAQRANPKGGYFREKVVCSFIGMAPAVDPKIVLFVAVNEPKGDEKTLYGGKVAAPAFANILDRVLKYLKVPPDKHPSQAAGKASDGEAVEGSISEKEPSDVSSTREVSFLNVVAANTLPVVAAAEMPKAGTRASASVEFSMVGVKMPDLRGMSLREVAKLLDKLDLKAIYDGHGIALEQNPAPGSAMTKGNRVVVKFSPRSSAP